MLRLTSAHDATAVMSYRCKMALKKYPPKLIHTRSRAHAHTYSRQMKSDMFVISPTAACLPVPNIFVVHGLYSLLFNKGKRKKEWDAALSAFELNPEDPSRANYTFFFPVQFDEIFAQFYICSTRTDFSRRLYKKMDVVTGSVKWSQCGSALSLYSLESRLLVKVHTLCI